MWHKTKTKYEILLELWHKKQMLCQIFTKISLLGISIQKIKLFFFQPIITKPLYTMMKIILLTITL